MSHTRVISDSLVCTRCNESYRFNMPIPVSLFVAAGNAFVREHEDCEPAPPAPPTEGTPK